jgi:hypothetical protein
VTSSILTTLALLIASLAASLVLTGSQPFWADDAAVMLAIGHLLLTAVTIVGALVGAARWAVGLGAGLAASLAVPAILHPISPAWIVMVVTAAAAVAGVLGTGLRAVVRGRPPADAPPRKAAGLALGLLAGPLLVAVPQPSGVDAADWVVAVGAVGIAVWYTRSGLGGLWAARLGTPLLAVGSLLVVPLPEAGLSAAGFLLLTWLAWSVDARVAAVPLAAPGRSVPIPAELAPGEILDAAGLDSRGRRKEQK